MMMTPKSIPHPELKSARRLKPLEMNAIRCQRRHTVLTPEQLDNIAKSEKNNGTVTNG